MCPLPARRGRAIACTPTTLNPCSTASPLLLPTLLLTDAFAQGTDNEQADCVQQAGIWSLSVSNNFIGNRCDHCSVPVGVHSCLRLHNCSCHICL